MRFVNITTCKLLFDIGSLDNQINSVTISNTGHHIVAAMDSGNINIYSVEALTSELSKVGCMALCNNMPCIGYK